MSEYKYIGNFSAVDPAYSRGMSCHDCKVDWTGCADNFVCPKCGQGDPPRHEINLDLSLPSKSVKKFNCSINVTIQAETEEGATDIFKEMLDSGYLSKQVKVFIYPQATIGIIKP